MKKDTLFQTPFFDKGHFKFNQAVTDVFDDMITRSVPGYNTLLSTLSTLLIEFCQSPISLLDLGCSTGNLIRFLATSATHSSVQVDYVGIDNSQPMLDKIQSYYTPGTLHSLRTECLDLAKELPVGSFSAITSILFLQFLEPSRRHVVLEYCYNALPSGGVFFLVEKMSQDDPALQSAFNTGYHRFKHSQGYSQTEIINKADALHSVLRPLTYQQNQALLQEVGFKTITSFYQCYNFVGLIGIK